MQSVVAESTEPDAPIPRHHPPALVHLGKVMVIESVVENTTDLSSFILRYRSKGGRRFKKIEMIPTERGHYRGSIQVTGTFKNGIEYYIEVFERSGRKGQDGSRAKPYFLEVLRIPLPFTFSKRPGEKEIRGKMPF